MAMIKPWTARTERRGWTWGNQNPHTLQRGSRVASLLGRLAGAPQRKNWTDVEMLYDPGPLS